jgi:hypothetical protein
MMDSKAALYNAFFGGFCANRSHGPSQRQPQLEIHAIAVRDRNKPRDIALSQFEITNDPFKLADDSRKEILVEVAGGVEDRPEDRAGFRARAICGPGRGAGHRGPDRRRGLKVWRYWHREEAKM